MNSRNKSVVDEIDNYIRQNLWFDFHVWRYDGENLIISGGIDLTYSHTLEISFTHVFFASTFFEGWTSNAKQTVIEIPDSELNKELNIKYEIEQGYQIFIIRTDNYKSDIYIAAKEISYNKDTVYYSLRENLGENERLADYLLNE